MKTKEEMLLEKAQNGDVQAMLDLGRIYYFPKLDFEKSLNWFQKAIDYGCNDALIEIARVYEQLDIQKASRFIEDRNNNVIDYELSIETISWYLKALEYYENNYQKSAQYACLAAELLSDEEEAISIDYEKAFQYYLYAANMEDKDDPYVDVARIHVSRMLEEGLGCDIDLEKAQYYRSKVKYEKR